jgi:hypothetical protein
VVWTGTFFPYGVEVFHEPMSKLVSGGSEHGLVSRPASESSRWRDKLGSPVVDVQTFWERFTISPGHLSSVRIADPCVVDVPIACASISRLDRSG